jgi:hypothetical protein
MPSAPNSGWLVRETNKGKRFESFLSSACDVLLGFIYTMTKLYAERGGESSDFCKIYIRNGKNTLEKAQKPGNLENFCHSFF